MLSIFSIFSFTDTATTEIYTLSLHDALLIYERTLAPLQHGAIEIKLESGSEWAAVSN